MSNSMDRRDFLKSMAASGTVAIASLPVLGATINHSLASGCKFFTVPQAALVEAIAEQMVPADENPGGKAAGVVFYIDGVLAGPFGKFYRDRYEEGIPMVDAASQKQFGGTFVSLGSDQQAAILKVLQLRDGPRSPEQEFFELLVRHVMEGYYGDPAHGGNRGGASWKMIGFGG
jgi:gluconate 2-dehydrogenase gamma chain